MAARGTCHERKSNCNPRELVGPNHPPCTRGASRNGSHEVAATREGLVAGHGQTSGKTDSFLPRMSASRAETKADPGEIDCSSRGSMDTPCCRSSGVIGGRSSLGNH